MGSEGHWWHMFNPYAYPFHEGLYRTYGTVARIYGFLGVRLARCNVFKVSLFVPIIRAGYPTCSL